MPSSVHACQLAMGTTKNRRLVIKEDVQMADFSCMVALGGSNGAGAGRAKTISTNKTLNDVRVEATLNMSSSMLLKGAL